MKEKIKELLKLAGLYHPLQSFYRSAIQSFQKHYNRYAYAKFGGSGFTCNVCGYSFRKFVNRFPSVANRKAIYENRVIAGYGKNIICPHCTSTARERLVLGVMQKMDLENNKVLHFSPEKNILLFVNRIACVTSADLFPGFYKTTDKNVVHADATALSYSNETFDIVIANHIMEHIPDDIAAMREIYRVLKPGGQAILQIPYSEVMGSTKEQPDIADPKKQSAMFGQKDHVRIYSLADYMRRLTSVGFEVGKVSYEDLHGFHKNAIQEGECFLRIIKPIS